jgi:hypothetical protein
MQDELGVRWETATGEPVTVGNATVTTESQALVVRWPRGGWVWNRPLAITIETDGETRRVPIVDVTRMAQVVLWAASVAFVVVALALTIKSRRERHE